MVSGNDVAKPSTIGWMSRYEAAVLTRFGYSSTRGCGKARLCPAFSLPDLFQSARVGRSRAGAERGPQASGRQTLTRPRSARCSA